MGTRRRRAGYLRAVFARGNLRSQGFRPARRKETQKTAFKQSQQNTGYVSFGRTDMADRDDRLRFHALVRRRHRVVQSLVLYAVYLRDPRLVYHHAGFQQNLGEADFLVFHRFRADLDDRSFFGAFLLSDHRLGLAFLYSLRSFADSDLLLVSLEKKQQARLFFGLEKLRLRRFEWKSPKRGKLTLR